MKRKITWNDGQVLRAVFKVLEYNTLGTGRIEGYRKVRMTLSAASTSHTYQDAIKELDRLIAVSERLQKAGLLKSKKRHNRQIQLSLEIGKQILEEVGGLNASV